MRKMKKWLALMVAGMMTVGLMGCSGSSDEGKKKSGSDKADMKAAVVFGLGGLGDQSYNDLAYEGMERAKEELGVDYDYAEPKEVTDFETILRAMSDSNEYEVIIGVGFDSVDALASVAPDYPDQKYASIDSSLVGDNIVSYSCKEQEGSFLVGALAAYMKQDAATYGLEDNHKYGFVGALENDIINHFAAGYRAGIEYVDSDADVAIQYVGEIIRLVIQQLQKKLQRLRRGKVMTSFSMQRADQVLVCLQQLRNLISLQSVQTQIRIS